MRAQDIDGRGRVPVHRRRLRRTPAARSSPSWPPSDPRIRVLDNPQRRTPFALNIGLRGGARASSSPAWTPTRATRRSTCGSASSGCARGGAAHVSGPQLAVGDGRPWSRPRRARAVAPRSAPAARPSAPARRRGVRGRHRLHRHVAPRRAAARRRLGRGVADRPGLRARLPPARDRARRARLPARDGRRVPPARLARGACAASTGSTGCTRSRRSAATRGAMRPSHLLPPRASPRRSPRGARQPRRARAGPGRLRRGAGRHRRAAPQRRARPPTPPRCRWSTRPCTSPTASACSPACAATASRPRRSPAPCAAGAAVRLAAYEDAIYQRDADGTLTVHRAFPLFMFGLAERGRGADRARPARPRARPLALRGPAGRGRLRAAAALRERRRPRAPSRARSAAPSRAVLARARARRRRLGQRAAPDGRRARGARAGRAGAGSCSACARTRWPTRAAASPAAAGRCSPSG